MKKLEQVLESAGISEREAKVYLTLLQLSESTPAAIAKFTGIKRSTVYLTLATLTTRGLVSSHRKGSKTFFSALNPHALLDDMHSRFQALEQVLPEIEQLGLSHKTIPQVTVYEGKKGLVRAMEDTLTTSMDLLCWGDVRLATSSVLEDYYPDYIRKKVAKNIWVRGIVSYDREAVEFKKRGVKELRELYLVPKEKFPFRNEINIYEDKVAIIAHADLVGVIIRNKNIADTQRSIFRLAFEYAPILERKILSERDRRYLGAPLGT